MTQYYSIRFIKYTTCSYRLLKVFHLDHEYHVLALQIACIYHTLQTHERQSLLAYRKLYCIVLVNLSYLFKYVLYS